ncbi:MAG: hypothetical protein WAW02_06780 [Sideroxyarcus sp.]
MIEEDKPKLNWDIQLNFDKPVIARAETPQAPKIPPRIIIGAKFPKILARIELLWGSIELHNYLEHTLFTDRSNRQGFPEDVLRALGEIHTEHIRVLKQKNLISVDVWDVYK